MSFFFNPRSATPPPFLPHASCRVNRKLSLNTGAPPLPQVPPSPPEPAAPPVPRHLGDLLPPRPCPADSLHPPTALATAAAAPRSPTHWWQSCHRARRCAVTTTLTHTAPHIAGRQAAVAARLGRAMGHAGWLARRGEQAAPSGGSSLWAGFGPAAGNPFFQF
jgi:hypothetical protein